MSDVKDRPKTADENKNDHEAITQTPITVEKKKNKDVHLNRVVLRAAAAYDKEFAKK